MLTPAQCCVEVMKMNVEGVETQTATECMLQMLLS
jgi:hypothetical protein